MMVLLIFTLIVRRSKSAGLEGPPLINQLLQREIVGTVGEGVMDLYKNKIRANDWAAVLQAWAQQQA